jgi:hypothetical protein
MASILTRDRPQNSHEEFRTAWDRYQNYLASISESLPVSARAFAVADWHYDFGDARSPHDGWVESVRVTEHSSGERRQNRWLDITIRMLGAYHDGYIELTYQRVHSYRLGSKGSSHGDWLYDEIRLSERGLVLHEIEIGGTAWEIESEDVVYEWKPMSEALLAPGTVTTPGATTTK